MNLQAIQISGPSRTELIRRGRYLEFVIIGYHNLEGRTRTERGHSRLAGCSRDVMADMPSSDADVNSCLIEKLSFELL